MGEKMSLQQVRDQIAAVATEDDYMLQGWIAALDAHLTQPAQAVDVGAAQEVLVELERVLGDVPNWRPVIDKLTAALRNANGKEG